MPNALGTLGKVSASAIPNRNIQTYRDTNPAAVARPSRVPPIRHTPMATTRRTP